MTINCKINSFVHCLDKEIGCEWPACEVSCAPTSHLGAHSRTGDLTRSVVAKMSLFPLRDSD